MILLNQSVRSAVHLVLISVVLMTGCKSYKQHVMFRYGENYPFSVISEQARTVESNYTILPDDYIKLEVYTKGGERIIDPDLELNKEIAGNRSTIGRPEPKYLILPDSTVKVPMVGYVKLGGLTIDQAKEILEDRYSGYYNDPYVLLEYINKRVVVLGAVEGMVVPLENEDMSVTEVIALAGGITKNTRVDNIRLFRGEMVYLVDLSTIEGYYRTNMRVESGDIIYIEPIPRVLTQGAQEISLIVSTITALTTLLVLILR